MSLSDEVMRQRAETQRLRVRLQRIVLALALTEDALADIYDRIADGHPLPHDMALHSKRARAAASECRRFAGRLGDLFEAGPPGPNDNLR